MSERLTLLPLENQDSICIDLVNEDAKSKTLDNKMDLNIETSYDAVIHDKSITEALSYNSEICERIETKIEGPGASGDTTKFDNENLYNAENSKKGIVEHRPCDQTRDTTENGKEEALDTAKENHTVTNEIGTQKEAAAASGQNMIFAEQVKSNNKISNQSVRKHCEICNYSTSLPGKLYNHIKQVHDKLKKFKGDFCDCRAYQSCHLKQHIKNNHERIKDMSCNMCSFASSSNAQVTLHKKRKHEKLSTPINAQKKETLGV